MDIITYLSFHSLIIFGIISFLIILFYTVLYSERNNSFKYSFLIKSSFLGSKTLKIFLSVLFFLGFVSSSLFFLFQKENGTSNTCGEIIFRQIELEREKYNNLSTDEKRKIKKTLEVNGYFLLENPTINALNCGFLLGNKNLNTLIYENNFIKEKELVSDLNNGNYKGNSLSVSEPFGGFLFSLLLVIFLLFLVGFFEYFQFIRTRFQIKNKELILNDSEKLISFCGNVTEGLGEVCFRYISNIERIKVKIKYSGENIIFDFFLEGELLFSCIFKKNVSFKKLSEYNYDIVSTFFGKEGRQEETLYNIVCEKLYYEIYLYLHGVSLDSK